MGGDVTARAALREGSGYNAVMLKYVRTTDIGASTTAIIAFTFLAIGCQRNDSAPPPPQQDNRLPVTRLAAGNLIDVDDPPIQFCRISPRKYGFDLPDYFMLETEVTNEVFARYLAETGTQKGDQEVVRSIDAKREAAERTGRMTHSSIDPSYSADNRALVWTANRPPAGTEQLPVALVNPKQASAFCAWLTRRHGALGTFRLPTKTEWLIAAYGRDRRYPWGDRSEEHTSELQSQSNLVCRLLLEKK